MLISGGATATSGRSHSRGWCADAVGRPKSIYDYWDYFLDYMGTTVDELVAIDQLELQLWKRVSLGLCFLLYRLHNNKDKPYTKRHADEDSFLCRTHNIIQAATTVRSKLATIIK